MQSIRVTSLEKFRRFMDNASNFDTEESLIQTLSGEFTGNDKTRFGSAFHKIIEDGFDKNFKQLPDGSLGQLVDDIFFPNTVAAPAYRYEKAHPHKISEVEVTKVFETPYFPIQVTGHIDVVEGYSLRDIKTKFRSVDFAEYYASCQWKFYLSMAEVDTFYYDLFEVKGFDGFSVDGIQRMDNVEIIAHEPFQCLRYDEMENDIQLILNDLLAYLHNRKLLHLLKPAIKENETLFF